MRTSEAGVLTLVLALGAAVQPVGADDGLSRCAAIEDASARLACFDEVAGRVERSPERSPKAEAVAAPAAASVPPVPAPVAAPAVSTPAGDFGMDRRSDTVDTITAVVSSVDRHPHIGRWVVTLDNGQVWEQRETTAPAKAPRPGDPVTIRRSSLGSYLLVAPGRGSNRVKRIR